MYSVKRIIMKRILNLQLKNEKAVDKNAELIFQNIENIKKV